MSSCGRHLQVRLQDAAAGKDVGVRLLGLSMLMFHTSREVSHLSRRCQAGARMPYLSQSRQRVSVRSFTGSRS
jgi:hypothetical protein